MLVYVKILAAGWKNFTGDFCGWEFKDAMSVSPVPRVIADRMSANLHCEISDLDGVELGQGGAAARLAGAKSIAADVTGPLATATEDELAAERAKALHDAGIQVGEKLYTEKELHAVASTEGIEGLRLIAKPYGVKDRSIAKLIVEIIKAQNTHLARKAELIEEQKRVRAAAGDEALKKMLDHEAKIAAAARVLVDDQTPNAIGPDGKAIYVAEKAAAPATLPADEKPADEKPAETTTDEPAPEQVEASTEAQKAIGEMAKEQTEGQPEGDQTESKPEGEQV